MKIKDVYDKIEAHLQAACPNGMACSMCFIDDCPREKCAREESIEIKDDIVIFGKEYYTTYPISNSLELSDKYENQTFYSKDDLMKHIKDFEAKHPNRNFNIGYYKNIK